MACDPELPDPGKKPWAELHPVDPAVRWAYSAGFLTAADVAHVLPSGPTSGPVAGLAIFVALTGALARTVFHRKK